MNKNEGFVPESTPWLPRESTDNPTINEEPQYSDEPKNNQSISEPPRTDSVDINQPTTTNKEESLQDQNALEITEKKLLSQDDPLLIQESIDQLFDINDPK